MLANKPIMTSFAYALMLIGFGFCFTGVYINPTPHNIPHLIGFMLTGMVLTFVSVGMFYYLLKKDNEVRRAALREILDDSGDE